MISPECTFRAARGLPGPPQDELRPRPGKAASEGNQDSVNDWDGA